MCFRTDRTVLVYKQIIFKKERIREYGFLR